MSKLAKILIIGCGLMLVFSNAVMAQKYGFIDDEKIKTNYKEWTKAQEQFNADLKQWDDQAALLEQELNQLISDYDKQKLILSADKKAEREAAINAKNQALQSFTKEISAPGGKAERRMQELVRPLYDKITAAIEQLAIEENYDMIFNSGSLAYAKEDLDVTDKVIEILEQGD